MSTRRVSCARSRLALACGIAAALAAEAAAQPSAPYDPAIDVQTFEYAVGPKTFVTVSNAEVAAKGQLALDALFTFLTKPFTIYNLDEDQMISGERVRVVESVAAGQLTAAYGVSDRLQLGARLPLVLAMRGDGLDPDRGMPAMGGLRVTGLGDLVVEGKLRLVRRGGARVAAIAALSLPSSVGSDGSQFLGDDLPALGGRIALQYDHRRFSIGANGGALLRKSRTIYDTTVGPALTWGAGAALRISDRFSVIAEGFGRTGLPDFSLDASPLEAIGGVRVYATSAIAVLVGGGAGLVEGIGSPEARFFLALGYAPDVRDSDGDGVPNGRDRCPLSAEDRDGFEDSDGCPDDDNDGDHRPDATDKCPAQAEDLDGFDDDDGCPELDNDRDGIADLSDKCPVDAEDGAAPSTTDGCPAGKRDTDGDGVPDTIDKCPVAEEDPDGWQDNDGCPDPDNDGDGVPDAADRCACAEDKDGWQDDDGCPDPDNDRDGIADKLDRCPAEAETVNGIADSDGCPDTGGANLVRLTDDRVVFDRVPALAGSALSPGGALLVDQLALVILANDDVRLWRLAVAQPTAAGAKQLADAIAARLAAKGVPAIRVELLHTTGAPNIGGVAQERGDPQVCP